MIDKTKIKLIPIDTRSQEEKDKEIDFTYGITEPVAWVAKPQSEWNRVTQRNQASSSSCVDHSIAEVVESQIGEIVSAHPLYAVRPNSPEEGSIPAQALQSLCATGTTLEKLDISNGLSEVQMDAPVIVQTPIKATNFGGVVVDVEQIAQAISQHKGVIMSFNLSWEEWEKNPGMPTVIPGATIDGGHELSGLDFIHFNMEHDIIAQNHWGDRDGFSIGGSGQVILTPEYILARCTSVYYIIPPQKQMTKENFLSFYQNTTYETTAGLCYDAVTDALTELGIFSPLVLIGALATVRTEVGRMYLPVREEISPIQANEQYNGILGNVVGSNDGFNFRGGGLIQLTGRDNYAKYGTELGIDLLNNSDMTLDLSTSAKILAQFFKDNGIDSFCNAQNWLKCRSAVNGVGADNLPNGWALFNSIITQFMSVME